MDVQTVFLDRDGVINRKAPEGEYVSTWRELEFLPGALEALRALHLSGIRVIVVTNQRGVATGKVNSELLSDLHERLRNACDHAGGHIDAIYACLHDAGTCECRKPAPGLLLRAKTEYPEIDFSRSLVIGDSASDLQAGWRVGSQLMLVGNAARQESEGRKLNEVGVTAFSVARSLTEAVQSILRSRQSVQR